MNFETRYFKRKILRGIIRAIQETPQWVRYYFGPILYPFFAVYGNRRATKLDRAAKAVRTSTASKLQVILVLKEKYYFYDARRCRNPKELQKKALRLLFANFLSKETALIICSRLYDLSFMEQELALRGEEKKEFRVMKGVCFSRALSSIETKEEIINFLKRFEYDPDFPETAKRQLMLNYLRAMTKKNVVQQMIDLRKHGWLSYSIGKDEECKELYEIRLKHFAETDFTLEQAEEIFELFRMDLEYADFKASLLLDHYEGVDENTYETIIFDEEEREEFRKKYFTGEYFLRKKMLLLVSQWSQQEFGEVLTLEEFFTKRKEQKEKVFLGQ